MAVDYYYDNNETIYASSEDYNASIPVGNSAETKICLGDLTALSGQSTVFVNWIRFEFKGTLISDPNPIADAFGWMVAGVAPSGHAVALSYYNRYQAIKGWPFKNSKRFFSIYRQTTSTDAGTQIRMVYTFSPRKALKLNRGQDICLATTVGGGTAGIQGLNSIVVQYKRGD